METSSLGFDCDVAIEQQELLDEKNSEFMMQPSISVNSETIERMVNNFFKES